MYTLSFYVCATDKSNLEISDFEQNFMTYYCALIVFHMEIKTIFYLPSKRMCGSTYINIFNNNVTGFQPGGWLQHTPVQVESE